MLYSSYAQTTLLERDCCILCWHLSVQYLLWVHFYFLFSSLLPFSFSIPVLHSEVGEGGTIVQIDENSSLWVLMNVWMKLYECHMVCTVLFVSLFFYFYFFNFFVWIVYFWTTQIGARFEVALMEILQCTQLPSETTAALRHGWSVKTQYSSRNQTPRSPSLIHCMCSNISISRSVQQTLHENFQTSARLCDCWLISWEPRTRRTGVRHAE